MRLRPAGLVVGGYPCPTTGQIAGSDIPSDGMYYLTTFGGGSDTQGMACGGTADGTWYYLADRDRFGCGAKVQITNLANGNSVVAQVADIGPNVCVEQAAGLPVIDASPMVSQHLFGNSSSGWEDHRSVLAQVVDPSTPTGPTTYVGSITTSLTLQGVVGSLLVVGGIAAIGLYFARDVAYPRYYARYRRNPGRGRRRRRSVAG
jgi:hypothetical protein